MTENTWGWIALGVLAYLWLTRTRTEPIVVPANGTGRRRDDMLPAIEPFEHTPYAGPSYNTGVAGGLGLPNSAVPPPGTLVLGPVTRGYWPRPDVTEIRSVIPFATLR
jgi:hypothetical protein